MIPIILHSAQRLPQPRNDVCTVPPVPGGPHIKLAQAKKLVIAYWEETPNQREGNHSHEYQFIL